MQGKFWVFVGNLKKILTVLRTTKDSTSSAQPAEQHPNIDSAWKQKDWQSLTKLNENEISLLPKRAQYAYMIAIAHARNNDLQSYEHFSKLATNWKLSYAKQAKLVGESHAASRIHKPSVEILRTLDLGMGWASNTVNTAIYRHHGIVSIGQYQFTAFYSSETTITIVRVAESGTKETFELTGTYRLRDAHNSISLGFDRDHCLHITYDQHGTKLKYRRSNSPYAINDWSDERPMTGLHEDRVTYPTFINPRLNYPLTLLYRDGQSDKGSARLKSFDEVMEQWIDHPLPILSGENNLPWSCNGYWNHPTLGDDGSLHLSFVWRTHSIGKEQLVNNINICYAKSFDNGLTWQTSRGIEYQLPITPVNSEVVLAVPPASNLINQCSMALDNKGLPHIAFYADDHNGIPQYYHLWQGQMGWKVSQVLQRKSPFQLKGIGTLPIPISRPEIIIDKDDKAHIIFRGDISNNRLAVTSASPPCYEPTVELETIWHEEVGYAEPVIDRSNWKKNNTLTLFIQNTHQPNGDVKSKTIYSHASLIDVKIS